jgi:hypothetical protein
MKTLLAAIALAVAAASAHAKIVAQTVDYQHNGKPMKGYLAYDDAKTGPRAGVLVVQEWWGVNDYIRMRTRQMAEMGYVAFAPDMYGEGKVTSDPQAGGRVVGRDQQGFRRLGRAREGRDRDPQEAAGRGRQPAGRDGVLLRRLDRAGARLQRRAAQGRGDVPRRPLPAERAAARQHQDLDRHPARRGRRVREARDRSPRPRRRSRPRTSTGTW